VVTSKEKTTSRRLCPILFSDAASALKNTRIPTTQAFECFVQGTLAARRLGASPWTGTCTARGRLSFLGAWLLIDDHKGKKPTAAQINDYKENYS